MIKLENLKKYYGASKGVEDITLTVNEGNIFGFVGPNGAGKSTTIRVLMGLINATSGYVEVLGKTTRDGIIEALNDIGYLPGEANFYGDLKVKELLEYSCKLKGRGKENIQYFADKFNLDLDKKIDALSLGNRKKVAIVNALLHKPKLLILDEPTGGLDPVMQHIFFDVLRDLNKSGSTIFFSSHILSEVQSFCEFVAVVKDGKIIKSGAVRDICGNSLKEVKLTFDKKVPKLDKDNFINNVVITDGLLSFDYSGKPGDLITLISKLQPIDVNINNADLERVIMHFYL